MLTTKKIVKTIDAKTDTLSSTVNGLTELINEMNNGAVQKAAKYEEIINLLKNVKINVKKFSSELKDNAMMSLKIEYEIPPIELIFDSENTLLVNERFRAMNLLNLISFEDMAKIQEQLKIVEKQNQKISGK